MMPKVAVVILNWNGAHFLAEYLPSVVASSYKNLDIYLADNGSTDNSVAFVQEHYPQINIILNNENYGFAEGYNQALKHVKADYYVLLNSDVKVTKNWIEPVIKVMAADERLCLAQPKIRAFYQQTHFEHAGAAGGWIDQLGYVFCRGRCFDICEEDTGQYDDYTEIFWATGAALFIKASVYHKLGGLDGDFFAHMEEIDLCWRAKRAGYHIVYCPDSVVYHLGGGSLPKSNPRKTYLNFRNNLVMLVKNYNTLQLLTLLPIRICLDFVAAIKTLVNGNIAETKAILQAQGHFFRHLPLWLKKRREVAQIVKTNRLNKATFNHKGMYKGSIIVAHFLQGKKYFSEIVKNN